MAVKKTPNRVIEGDDIQEQIDALPELMYLTRTNPDNPAIWETYNPKTGEIVDTGVFEGGGDRGLLAASRPVLALAASVLGAPYLSNLIAGSTGLTGSALAGATGATIAGGSTALTGGSAEETLKAALLGGGGAFVGSEISDLLKPSIDASTLTSEEFNDLISKGFAEELKKAGVTNVTEFTSNVGGNAQTFYDAAGNPIVAPPVATPVALPISTDNLVIDALRPVATPAAPSLSSVIASLALPPIEAVKVTETKEKDKTVTPTVPTTPIETLEVTALRPIDPVTPPAPPSIPSVPVVLPPVPVTPPTTPPKPPEPPPKDKKEITITDVIKTIAPIAVPALVAKALTPTPPTTGFDIVPVPADWKTPPAPTVAPFTQLPPIDFGTRNLLMGTQWEKFLDPNYGKVPEPVKYSQPSNLSYNDLMSILGSRQGMPSASSLSINDIISGIQNQYGQTPTRTMG
jgi:hypothetical protein